MSNWMIRAVCPLALLLSWSQLACRDDLSGECTGSIDGELYNLRVYNCTNGEMQVKVNDRTVGTVPGVDLDGVCGVTDLGSFPQCSEGEIIAYGNFSKTQKAVWSEDTVGTNPDGCWVVGVIYGEAEHPNDDLELPETDPITGSQCQFLEFED